MSALGRRPFVLLEDLEKGTAALYESPYATVTAATISEVADALRHADALVEDGAHLAGWIGYEAGYALEPRLQPLLDRQWRKSPLLRLFAFPQPRIFPADAVDHWLSGMARRDAHLDPLEPVIGFQDYAAAFRRVKDAIEAGDIYQANLTFPLQGRWRGDPLALYRAIRPEANARFAALIFDGRDWLLSFSPELFFSLSDDTLKVRPMKGTRPRGADAESDRRLARELAESVKDRAENLMIVDLMRNDLSRISQPGSVKVDRLFRVETYPTVFQMTTGISSRVDGPPAMSRILQAMFPCGSITGAPKMRAMEIIHEVEHWSRGPYCGAIGAFARTERGEGSDQVRGWRGRFNVAIRTLRLRPGVNGRLGTALFGVGSGIVADSVLEEEWEECLLKARFVERGLARRISEQVQGRKVG